MNQQQNKPVYPQLSQMQAGQQPGTQPGQQPNQQPGIKPGLQPGQQSGFQQSYAGQGIGQNQYQGPQPQPQTPTYETPRDPEEIEKEAVVNAGKDGYVLLKWIVLIAALILLSYIAVVAIISISNLASDTGFTLFGWFKTASLNPGNPHGFRNLTRLVLITGFLFLVIMILEKKGKL